MQTDIVRRSLAGALALLSLCLLSTHAVAAAPAKEVAGGADHPLVTRFPGSRLVGYQRQGWGETAFPLSAEYDTSKEKFGKAVTVEGTITRLYYLGPQGTTPLEVFRNYQQAFAKAGLKVVFSCEGNCRYLYFRWRFGEVRNAVRWSDDYLRSARDTSRWSIEDMLDEEQGRGFYGTLAQGGRDIHVWVYTSIAGYAPVEASGTVIEIAEPKPMTTGQVTVDASALARGLAADGRIALYGIEFDTAKSTLKPSSDAQLEQMAKLLAAQPKLAVFVVGHTDNQGSFDANLLLSKQRAEAVRDALVTRYKVATARITPYGVANVAPVASNAEEAGRARNRRVELVAR